MRADKLIHAITNHFSGEKASLIVTALRQDPSIWQELENNQEVGKLLAQQPAAPGDLSPAAVGLLAVDSKARAGDLQENINLSIEPEVLQDCINIYDGCITAGNMPVNLSTAAAIALALRERRRIAGSWDAVLDMPTMHLPASKPGMMQLWQTGFACLYGMIPEPLELLRLMLRKQIGTSTIGWVIHTLLCQPLESAERSEIMAGLLMDLSLSYQVEWLKILAARGADELAAALAKAMISADLPGMAGIWEESSPAEYETTAAAEKVVRLKEAAQLYRIGGYPAQSAALLNQAREILLHSLAGVEVRLGGLDQDGETDAKASVSVAKLAMKSTGLQVQLVTGKKSVDWETVLLASELPERLHPLAALQRSGLLAAGGDLDAARETAAAVLPQLLALVKAGQLPEKWDAVQTLEDLRNLGLIHECLELMEAVLQVRPGDLIFLEYCSQFYQSQGQTAEAIETAALAAVLRPDDSSAVVRLANLYERDGQWEEAYQQHEVLAQGEAGKAVEQRLALSHAALQSGHLDRIFDICGELLQQDPDYGKAHGLIGLAYRAKGYQEESFEHLSRATLLCPEDPQPWLALAAIQREDGQLQRGLQTLKAAVLAVPDSPELNFALATSCLENGLPSEALPFLWEANRLNPDLPEISWKLGKTLFDLGHRKEARKVLEGARRKWPEHAQLAVTDAYTLVEDGAIEDAVSALEVALRSDQPNPEWYLLYARAILGDSRHEGIFHTTGLTAEQLEPARSALQQSVDLLNDPFEARLLLAEVQYAAGDVNEAYEGYTSLADRPETALKQWQWRVQAGIGRAALAQGKNEQAVAALTETASVRPQDRAVLHLLAEAYAAANLEQEAAETAGECLMLAADQVDNLAWYIQLMTRLGRETETRDALDRVTRLQPEDAGYWNQLARVQQKLGDRDAAYESLASIQNIADLPVNQLWEAAKTYFLMGDRPSALECLQRVKQTQVRTDVALVYDIARLQQSLGRPDTALVEVELGLQAQPYMNELILFKADLLAEMSRTAEAAACLEDSLTHIQPGSEILKASLVKTAAGEDTDLQPEAVRKAMLVRLVCLLVQEKRQAEALRYAEEAVELSPYDLPMRVVTAGLADAQLFPAKARRLASLHRGEIGDSEAPEEERWMLSLIALNAQMALDAGEDSEAARIFDEFGAQIVASHRHLLAVQARLLLRMGDLRGAEEALKAARRQVEEDGEPISLWNVYTGAAQLALADAGCELGQWQAAFADMDDYLAGHPDEPRANLRLARMIVLAAEQQRLCNEVRCITHAPGTEVLDAAMEERFNQAAAVAVAAGSQELAEWKVRAQAVFHPSLQNAPALAKLPVSGEHAAALLSVMRLSKNAANAVRIVHHYPETPDLLVQMALCYREVDPGKGVESAVKAVEDQEYQPLHHAVLAAAYEANQDYDMALQALESALVRWPDEPEWHRWAAQLSELSGSPAGAVDHLEKALAINPDVPDYALKLGKIVLDRQDPLRSVEVLEDASRRSPQNQAVWMALARAYLAAGKLTEAMDACALAVQLSENDPAAYLLSGEIALQMGKINQALEFARIAQECRAANPDAVLFLSRVLVQKGQLAEALTALETSLPTLQNSLAVMLERANLVRRLHGPQVALPVFQELRQLFPQNATVLSLLAQTQADCGDLKAAEHTAFIAHQLNPELSQINLLLGRLQHNAGQLDQAIHFLSESIRQSPGDIDAYLELGQAYLERREYLQSLKTYQQAIKAAPRDNRPYYRAAMVLRESKDYQGAESMLRRAADLAPEDLNIRRQLGAVVALNLVHNSQEVNSLL